MSRIYGAPLCVTLRNLVSLKQDCMMARIGQCGAIRDTGWPEPRVYTEFANLRHLFGIPVWGRVN